ncbi:MAG: S41 family peptidase [Chitinophagaceae bacterium]
MKKIFLLSLLFILTKSYGQNCNCNESLHYVENLIEKNSPSYINDVIDLHKEKKYQQFKNGLDKKSLQLNISDSFSCMSLISQYFSFFRDEHIQMNYKDSFWGNLDFDDTLATKIFFKKYPFVNNYTIPNKVDNKSIVGYWQSEDGRNKFLIVPDTSAVREYAGIVLNGDSLFWSKNQIMFEFTQKGNNEYRCTRWVSSRQPRTYTAQLNDSILVIARTHKFLRVKDANHEIPRQMLAYGGAFSFKELSPSTNYIRIPTFYESHDIIDSIINVNKALIESKPNLIIDIRDNGGGSDDSYAPLLPYIYNTKKVSSPYTMSFYATKHNNEGFENAVRKNGYFKRDSTKFLDMFKEHRQNEGNFMQPHFSSIAIDTIFEYPKRVAIITNSGDASSAEGFVMVAKESSKVTTYGENTGGCFNYGNIIMTSVPCLPIVIGVPTSKVFFVHPEYKNLEDIGFKPDVSLIQYKSDKWIDVVKEKMEFKK